MYIFILVVATCKCIISRCRDRSVYLMPLYFVPAPVPTLLERFPKEHYEQNNKL